MKGAVLMFLACTCTPAVTPLDAGDGGITIVSTDAPAPPVQGPCQTGCAQARTLKCSDVTANCEIVCERAVAEHSTIWARYVPGVGPMCWTTAKDIPSLVACGGFNCQ